ncbi:MAG: transporter substrate-binding domain-containing protein [Bacteroidales bacterium]|nr:transporter substrate-binding domain-containing protein [Bacteroidales bacterium]
MTGEFAISKPLTKNLLGYRIPIIRAADSATFNSVTTEKDIQKLKHGIPSTWSDATIFRHNGYEVVEKGSFGDIFERLASGRFDYSAYGANEVMGVFENRASKQEGLMIDNNTILFYPFPLVFYINPEMPGLAKRIEQGLQVIHESGTLDAIFNDYYGNITEELELDQRRIFILHNPLIPDEFADLKPDLTHVKVSE